MLKIHKFVESPTGRRIAVRRAIAYRGHKPSYRFSNGSFLCLQHYTARKNLADDSKVLDYTKFRKVTIRKIFDFLHGVDFEDIELSIGMEIIAWTNFDGQV